MSPLALSEKLLVLHRNLDAADVPHAFGGAIALAYCTGEPRATIDIDLNLFVQTSEAERVLGDLPDGVASDHQDLDLALADDQVRLFWDDTPVDLFFSYHPFHTDLARRVRTVPFADTLIPVLSCEDLLVFKAFFARTKDWADIEAMAATDALDLPAACQRVAALLGTDHPSYRALLATTESGPPGTPPLPRLP
ncbi:MAG TPA: hypothetical protein VIJ09_07880 [Acidimicrobiales bacterium]